MSELEPRYSHFSRLRIPLKYVQDATRTLQTPIPIKEASNRQCFVLKSTNKSNCRAKLLGRYKGYPVQAFSDCYQKQKCPGKRDDIPGQYNRSPLFGSHGTESLADSDTEPETSLQIEERDSICGHSLERKPDEWYLNFKSQALNGQERMSTRVPHCCFYMRRLNVNNICKRLQGPRGEFSKILFQACYEIARCGRMKRDALP
ncbi:MAG: hypothetical protein Q9169_008362, partial [Polycauliona sp. 2 TL-2023]